MTEPTDILSIFSTDVTLLVFFRKYSTNLKLKLTLYTWNTLYCSAVVVCSKTAKLYHLSSTINIFGVLSVKKVCIFLQVGSKFLVRRLYFDWKKTSGPHPGLLHKVMMPCIYTVYMHICHEHIPELTLNILKPV